ncbi:protein SPMIP1 [Ambystoma mexicanum]|uniref:protein SPMIP1 n=1 Tax=Ambystoma mexicanum TaxID=8296 RepID=UPI0037E99C81
MKDLLTTRNQNTWKELIEKEAYTRVSWKLKYGQQQQEQPPLGARRRRVLTKLPAVPTLPMISSPVKEEREAERPAPRELLRSQDAFSQAEMRPATPLTRNLLYDGFSKEGKGRSMYLQRRKREGPEEKFPHPVLSSWEYGWRIGDVVKDAPNPIHGRSAIVKDTFFIRNGVFHHPSKTDRMLNSLA